MHQMLVVFFALIFASGRASHEPKYDTFQPEEAYITDPAPAPTRQELAQASFANSYAGSACLSCRRMNAAPTQVSTNVFLRVR
jgi:hypothetical protein